MDYWSAVDGVSLPSAPHGIDFTPPAQKTTKLLFCNADVAKNKKLPKYLQEKKAIFAKVQQQ